MVSWQDALLTVANNIEERYDALKYRLTQRLQCHRPLVIEPYRTYGTENQLYVRGRVLEYRGVTSARDSDSTWDNLLNMYRRFDSNEVPYARLLARYSNKTQEIDANEEGFFETWLSVGPAQSSRVSTATGAGTEVAGGMTTGEQDRPMGIPEDAGRGLWRKVDLELLTPVCSDGRPVRAASYVLVPPPTARYGVISDIDDTVIRTDAAHLLKMARTVFLGNARLRLPFEGVGGFYRALYEGATGQEHNPLFYVSNSPWNMYDLFSDFFQMQDIPIGPVLVLRDWGLSRRAEDSGPLHSRAFKTAAIRKIIDLYPELPFILIGDSGEKDPEVYEAIVAHAPGRVRAVYIRNVSRKPARATAINKLAERVLAAGSTLILADNTVPLAEHALANGWISPKGLPRVQEATAADQAAATPLEKLLSGEGKAPGPTVVIGEPAPSSESASVQDALAAGDAAQQKTPTVVVEGDKSKQD